MLRMTRVLVVLLTVALLGVACSSSGDTAAEALPLLATGEPEEAGVYLVIEADSGTVGDLAGQLYVLVDRAVNDGVVDAGTGA